MCAVATARLPSMVDTRSGLVVFRADGDRLVPAGTSIRYTAITALGIERAERCGLPVAIDVGRLYAALDRVLPSIDNSGDLGLMLWAMARQARQSAERALDSLLGFGELTRLRRGDAFHSTELAWVATGLAEALASDVGRPRDVRALLDGVFARLVKNQGASGLLAFSKPRARPSWRQLLGTELGFFDAQVYGIVSALRRNEVVGDPDARHFALRIGQQILRHQRSHGQWAWHYNVRTGELVDLYPVYSVHQDGMAPMALRMLEHATGTPTGDAIAKGVEWLFGHNELGANMVDPERGIVWRSIRRCPAVRSILYPLKVASLGRAAAPARLRRRSGAEFDWGTRLSTAPLLEVDHELRPYHLGWCLYALSDLAARYRLERRNLDGAPASSARFAA